MYVHVYLVPNCYNSYISLHDDDADLIILTLYIFLIQKFEICSKTVKNFLGTGSDAADETADKDDFDEDAHDQEQHAHAEQNGRSGSTSDT